ncbi:hypothetical protein EUGRSUZ_H05063 [Eucalyptus grandis]|uniref:Uncharacterized protein n=2 Tax=Eucalyptus grandis TaxID=71139 RepID=A0ACC3JZM4_EUCGR|nr:hypothetical protein EUGRSUZ_H05063 [Eucalyptus grandis]
MCINQAWNKDSKIILEEMTKRSNIAEEWISVFWNLCQPHFQKDHRREIKPKLSPFTVSHPNFQHSLWEPQDECSFCYLPHTRMEFRVQFIINNCNCGK